MDSTRIAVDLAKSVFQVAVSSVPGRIDEQHRLSRERFQRFFAARSSTHVLMEACGTAHHWGRHLEALGHRVSLLPASDVARYRDGNKTDRADTVAILEAGRNEAIDPVPVKSLELRCGHNKATVALANRLARIAWRIWRDRRPYQRLFQHRHRRPRRSPHPLTSCTETSRMAHGLTGVGKSR